MSGFRIEGNTTGNVAEVNAANQLKIVAETNAAGNPGNVGGARLFSEVDSGTKTGAALLRSPEVSPDSRLRVGVDTLLDTETFNYTSQNTNKHSYGFTTLTMDLNAQSLRTNALGGTAINTNARLRTFKYFPLFGKNSPLYVETLGAFSAAIATNTTIDFGTFLDSGAGPYAPTDGTYFRANSAGVFGVVNYNGTESTTSAFAFTVTPNQFYNFSVTATERSVQFFIDDVLYATIATQVGQGQFQASVAAPWAVRHVIGGTAASTAMNFRVADYSVWLGDIATNKPWGQQMSGMGGHSLSAQQGLTQGQLGTYALNTAPAAVTLTASTAPATNTLGGAFLLPVAIAVGESDYPLFAWQNPLGTTAIQGKTFYCTGIVLAESWVLTTLVGGPVILQYALGVGSTAASLATTESASFATGTTKIARKTILGAQTFAATAAQGVLSPGFQRVFPDSLPVQPGEFLHLILRCQGVATTAGAIRGGITVTGYFA